VKLTAVLLTMAVAVALQLTLARYTVGGQWPFDLVLVGVVFCALNWGPVAGMFAGSAGGLVQDMLSNDIVGTGGLVKTLVGFGTGTLGAQFLITRPSSRAAMLAGASIVHRLLMVGLHGLIDQQWPAVFMPGVLAETFLNAICGLVAFQVMESLPGVVARGRQARRTGLRRREW
jgi:rod shape-determining protein MreD